MIFSGDVGGGVVRELLKRQKVKIKHYRKLKILKLMIW